VRSSAPRVVPAETTDGVIAAVPSARRYIDPASVTQAIAKGVLFALPTTGGGDAQRQKSAAPTVTLITVEGRRASRFTRTRATSCEMVVNAAACVGGDRPDGGGEFRGRGRAPSTGYGPDPRLHTRRAGPDADDARPRSLVYTTPKGPGC